MSTQPYSGNYGPDIRMANFSGGFVDVPAVISKAGIALNQLERAQNVDVSGRSIRKMRGFSRVTSSPVTGDVSALHYDPDTTNIYLSYSTKLAKLSAGAVSDLTGATGFTANQMFCFARLNDYLFCCNGADAPKKWDEGLSTISAITTPPGTWGPGNYPYMCGTWMGRIFAVTNGPDKDILYYSKLYDPDVWSAGTTATDGGAMRIGDDGIPIRALIPLTNGFLVVKDPGLYYVSGSGTFNSSTTRVEFDQTKFDWNLVSPKIDCVGPKAWVAISDSVFIWGRENVYELKGVFSSSEVSAQVISSNISNSVKQASMFRTQVCAAAYSTRNQIWFSVARNSGSSAIDTVYVYDYTNVDAKGVGSWTMRTGYSHRCMANVRDDAGQEQIYSGGYNGNGYVFKQNDGVDFDTVAMECIAWTSWAPLGVAGKGRVMTAGIMLGQQTSQPLQYSYAYDFADDYYDSDILQGDDPSSIWNTTGSSTWGDTAGGTTGTWISSPTFIQEISLFGEGRRIQHRFYSNLLNSDFDILEILHPVISVGYA